MAVAWPAPLRLLCGRDVRSTTQIGTVNRHIPSVEGEGTKYYVVLVGRFIWKTGTSCAGILPKHKKMLLFRWHWFVSKLLFDEDTAPGGVLYFIERRGRLVVNSSNVRSERMFYFHFLPPPRGRDSIQRNSYAVLPDYRHLVTLTGGRISKI